MPIGNLNPRDTLLSASVRPPHVNTLTGERRWYADGQTVWGQDLNAIIAQLREAADHYGVTDSEGNDGSLQETIAAAVGSLNANMPQATLKGRAAGTGTGPAQDLSPALAKALLAITPSDVSGLGALATLSTVGTAQLANAAVTPEKLANVAASTIRGRISSGAGVVENLTAAQAKTILAIAAADVSGLGTLATKSSIANADVAVNAAIAYTKLATINANSFLGNNTGSAATPISLTAAQAKTLLAIAAADVSGLGALATLNTVSTAQVTGLGALATLNTVDTAQIANNAVTDAKIPAGAITNASLANMGISTIKGRISTVGAPQDLTAAQAKTLLAIAFTDVSGTIANAQLPFRIREVTAPVVADFDDIKENGWYVGNITTANNPIGGNAQLLVQMWGAVTYGTQTVFALLGPSTNTNSWRRHLSNGVWTAWYRLRSSEAELDLLYASNSHTHAVGDISTNGLSIIGKNTVGIGSAIALTAAQTKTLLAIAAADVSGLGALATLSAVGTAQISDNSVTDAKIPAGTITNASLANMVASTIKGRITTNGAPQDLTAAQVKTLLAIAAADVSGLGALATLSAVGTAQIADGAVTNIKLSTIATARIMGRVSAGTGLVEDLTAAQAKTVLAIAAADVSGLGALATLSTVGTAQIDNNSVTDAKIPAGAITNASLANMAQATFKGRASGAGTGAPVDLTAAQAKTALAIVFNDLGGVINNTQLPQRLRESALNTVDLDTALTNGWYLAGPAAANSPAAVNLHVFVSTWTTGLYCEQTAYALNGGSATDANAWRRHLINGTWGSWYRLRIKETEMNALYAAISHTHAVGDITTTANSIIGKNTAGNGAALSLTMPQAKAMLAIAFGDVSGTIANSQLPTRLQENGSDVTDYNDAIALGHYAVSAGTTNAPAGGAYLLKVFASNASNVEQIAHHIGNTSASDTAAWRRARVSGVWGAWYRIRMSQDELDARYHTPYTATTAAELTFPIGHHILVVTAAAVQRNADVTPYIGAGTGTYSTTVSGTALTGTWRARGMIGTTTVLAERVA